MKYITINQAIKIFNLLATYKGCLLLTILFLGAMGLLALYTVFIVVTKNQD